MDNRAAARLAGHQPDRRAHKQRPKQRFEPWPNVPSSSPWPAFNEIAPQRYDAFVMSATGLGCAKTQASAGRVEVSRTKWCITESNRAVLIQFDGALENCIFYISPMYEFSHSHGHSRRFVNVANTSALPPTADMERTSICVAMGHNPTWRLPSTFRACLGDVAGVLDEKLRGGANAVHWAYTAIVKSGSRSPHQLLG